MEAIIIVSASRLAEDQTKLSAHLGALADVIREAHFWAEQEGALQIGAAQVQRAVDEKVERSSLLREHIQELIARGRC